MIFCKILKLFDIFAFRSFMKDIIFKILIYITVIYFLIYYYRLVLPYVEYEVNKEYIEKNLCENRDKPWMNCHGKCHLKKQIKKASEEDKKHNPFITTENTLLFFLTNVSLSEFDYSSNLLKNTYYYNFYNYIFISEILKPPQY